MDKNTFIDLVFKKAKQKNIEEFEIYFLSGTNTSLKVYNEKIDSFSDNQNQGISFRGKFKEKMGYSYTESFTEEDADFLIKEAEENASVIESDDEQIIYDGKGNYVSVETYDSSLENLEISKIEEFLINMEKEALQYDSRIKRVSTCVFGMGKSERIIKNSKGVDLRDRGNVAYVYISVAAEENGIIKTGSEFKVGRDFNEFNYKEISHRAAYKALSKFNSISVDLKESRCVIENLAFTSLLESIAGIFSAEAVQKGVSLLKGKIGEKIASDKVSVIDNPHLEKSEGAASFDSEGVPTKYKELISNGVLKTYLYNLKTAKKDGVESTGNASKGGYKGTVGISSFNLYVQNGVKSFEELLKDVNEGILITDFAGLHSGLNSISGDFSLAAEGFIIENGKKGRALNQMTVAGNFFEVLKNIEEVGNDIRFSLSSTGSPSVIIKNLYFSVD
ncbi:TldD/PmbA family protein [Fusobacterium perfoetens]|uniref:TldD/PmbA family protein n=1 Tax=Fusobacterium perfoetens TaxID=852 RepID=UPI001F3D7F6A|nr:TldD/PmbA family protein [Fusobacterium perfoetens]MCF2626397.1 TldD/PmbA family protein [Fusobacterium perfoetens]